MKKTTADSWPWQSYPGENFDRITALALQLADHARANGRAEPQYGYSHDDVLRAKEMIKISAT